MKALAKALIETTVFLELSSEDALCSDDAVRTLESVADILRSASPEELAAIRATLRELIAAERVGPARSDVLHAYEGFFANFGLPGGEAIK